MIIFPDINDGGGALSVTASSVFLLYALTPLDQGSSLFSYRQLARPLLQNKM